MTEKQPRYPVYVPSKGRADQCLTAEMFVLDGVPFRLVIEEAEYDAYASRYGEDRILVLPFSDQGSVVPARNWIMEHSIAEGHKRHWQYDDNIRRMHRLYGEKRLYARAGITLAVCEDFTDRYTNVAISGFQYSMFVPEITAVSGPFILNCHVYSCSLINNEIPHRWRGRYNEDTDLCLQVLSDGWCTILLQAFLADKIWTMRMTGGNTDALYGGQRKLNGKPDAPDDGRLKMARSLERDWPGVVTTKRRFQRPQHVVAASWRKFDTPLIKRDDLDIPDEPNEYGMKLATLQPIESPLLRRIADDYNKGK